MKLVKETIVAIATPAGRGGVGIVRISGPGAADVLSCIVPDWPADQPSHLLRLVRMMDAQGELVDEALAVLMRGPRSYTGEDVVELQCHGGPIILSRLMDAALTAGARVAEPGEFTQRAFLNGRLDLTQAEAVADLVNATSQSAHKQALEHLQGQLGASIRAQRTLLFEAATLIEAALDFSHEEHVYQIERDEVSSRLEKVYEALIELRERFDQGRRQREGVRAVLAGPTNAGKSTLFNALYGTERAIVTAVAGTTRDFLEEELLLGGTSVRLVDTAGLRQTLDEVEAIGIKRSREWMTKADIIIRMIDRAAGLDQEQREELEALSQVKTPVIVVVNKVDLPSALSADDELLLARFEVVLHTALGASGERAGLEALKRELATKAQELTSGEGVVISRARHLACVRESIAAIERAQGALKAQLDHELVALDVREALDALGEIVGHVSTDDILHKIFAEFCVGK